MTSRYTGPAIPERRLRVALQEGCHLVAVLKRWQRGEKLRRGPAGAEEREVSLQARPPRRRS